MSNVCQYLTGKRQNIPESKVSHYEIRDFRILFGKGLCLYHERCHEMEI